MPVIPTFILKRLYVVGSLANTEDGFRLSIRNTLAPGTIVGLGPITVDESAYDPAAITVQMGDQEWAAPQISPENPLRFAMNSTAILKVKGKPLPSGMHRISIVTHTREAGELEIEAQDKL